jgi:outer membrane murein-binding lipoprotein Lpp
MRNILIFILLLAGCATSNTRIQPLAKIQKPVVTDTSAMDANITELEKAVNRASSRIDRIQLLIDAIE